MNGKSVKKIDNTEQEDRLREEYMEARKVLEDIKGRWMLLNIDDILGNMDEILSVLDSGHHYGFKCLESSHNMKVSHINITDRQYEAIFIDYFQTTDEWADYTMHITICPGLKTCSCYLNDAPFRYMNCCN